MSSTRWEPVLPYIPSGRPQPSFRQPTVGSPRDSSPSSSDSDGSTSSDGGAGPSGPSTSRLPNIEDIYDLTTADLANLEQRLGAKVCSQKEERLLELARIELKERRGADQIGLALLGGHFDLTRAIQEAAAAAAAATTTATTTTPVSPGSSAYTASADDARRSSSSALSSALGAQIDRVNFPKRQRSADLLNTRGPPSPASSSPLAASSSSSPPAARRTPPRRPSNAEVWTLDAATPSSSSFSSHRVRSQESSQRGPQPVPVQHGFKPTPVSFDFVIGSSSVKKTPKASTAKKKAKASTAATAGDSEKRGEKSDRQREGGTSKKNNSNSNNSSNNNSNNGSKDPRGKGSGKNSARKSSEPQMKETAARGKPPPAPRSPASFAPPTSGDQRREPSPWEEGHPASSKGEAQELSGAGAQPAVHISPGSRTASSPSAPPCALPYSAYAPGAAAAAPVAPSQPRRCPSSPRPAPSPRASSGQAVGGGPGGAGGSESQSRRPGSGEVDPLADNDELDDLNLLFAKEQDELDQPTFLDRSGGNAHARLGATGSSNISQSKDGNGRAMPEATQGDLQGVAPSATSAGPDAGQGQGQGQDQDRDGTTQELDQNRSSGPGPGPGSGPDPSSGRGPEPEGGESIVGLGDEELEVQLGTKATEEVQPDEGAEGDEDAAAAAAAAAGEEEHAEEEAEAEAEAEDAADDEEAEEEDEDEEGDEPTEPRLRENPMWSASEHPNSVSQGLAFTDGVEDEEEAIEGGEDDPVAPDAIPEPDAGRSASSVRTSKSERLRADKKTATAAATTASTAATASAGAKTAANAPPSSGRRQDVSTSKGASRKDAGSAPSAEPKSKQSARRPPLPHDALRPKETTRSTRTTDLDLMGIDPEILARGEVTSYAEFFANIAAIFTWGSSPTAETSQHKERYLREALQTFQQFCNIVGSLETQFTQVLAPMDHSTPAATQHALHAANSRGAGIYSVFLREIIDKISEPTASPVPRSLEPANIFAVKYYKVVQNRTEVYDIVTRVFHRTPGWEELPHGMGLANVWNLCWTWSKPKVDYSRLCVWQKVNHFPENKHLTRKDCLKRTIDRFTRSNGKFAQYFTIMPRTFVLPKEYVPFIDCFAQVEEENAEAKPGDKVPNLWILKPAGSSRGRGIQVVNDVGCVHPGELSIIQQYISNPFLLGGYKWDMRVYVTVTSFNPLEAFLYKDGFARFTTVPYSNNTDDIDNKFVHLTNSSIQRHNEDTMLNTNQDDQASRARIQDAIVGGTKINFATLKARLQAAGVSWDMVWGRMIEVILKSLCMAEDHIPAQANSFELFGYDLMLDSRLKVWLIEVNSSPSMGQEHLLDEQVKQPLINDTIHLVDPMSFDRRRLAEALQRRFTKAASGAANSRQQLDLDLHSILLGERPRRHGEMPKNLGKYERIAPGEVFNAIAKARSSIFHSRRPGGGATTTTTGGGGGGAAATATTGGAAGAQAQPGGASAQQGDGGETPKTPSSLGATTR